MVYLDLSQGRFLALPSLTLNPAWVTILGRWGGGGGLSVGFTLLVFVLGLSAVTGSCVTEITHCGKRVTIFATY